MSAPKGRDGRTLKGAALAAHQRAHGRKGSHHKGGRKSNPGGAMTNPPKPNRRAPRRRNGTTFVTALGRVLGAGAAMFATGVLVTVGVSKISPGSKVSGYGIPAVAGLLGAGVATRWPLVGAGIAAGAAAPFVLPVAQRVMQPSLTAGSSTTSSTTSTVSSVRALRPGALGAISMRAVNMRAVSMGRVAMAG